MIDNDQQIRDLAQAIANQAQAIADGRTSASPHTVALLLRGNIETLIAWTAASQ